MQGKRSWDPAPQPSCSLREATCGLLAAWALGPKQIPRVQGMKRLGKKVESVFCRGGDLCPP